MRLNNGSQLRMVTLGSRQRGYRCQVYALDDPEYDPQRKVQERYSELAAALEYHIARIVIPMLAPNRIKFLWIGTMLGARSYLYHVCYSRDPKYRQWCRRIQDIAIRDRDTGQIVDSKWQDRFPVKSLIFLEQTMGREAFDSEYQNICAKETDRVLRIEHVRNEYELDKVPDNLSEHGQPHLPHPDAVMKYHYFRGYSPIEKGRMLWQPDTVKAGDYFSRCTKIATIDYARSLRAAADSKCLAIQGFDLRDTRWLLDLWLGKMKDPEFIDLVIRWCAAWRVHIIAPEDVGLQRDLSDAIQKRLYEGESEGVIPADWRPMIVPLKYLAGLDQPESKGPRIKASMELPMQRGAIKFPCTYKHAWPFNELYKQIEAFTADLKHLRHDDAVDTVSMARWVQHPRGSAEPTYGVDPVKDIHTLIAQGKPWIAGQEGLVGMPLKEIRTEYLAQIIKMDYDNEQRQREAGALEHVWPKPIVVG